MDAGVPLSDVVREYSLLGVSCTAYPNNAGAVAHVKTLIERATRGYTVAINAEKIVRSQDDPAFRQLVENASLRVPDGAGAVLALRLLCKVRSAKIDFPKAVLEAAAALGERARMAVIGATEASHQRAIAEIRRRYPGIRIVMNRCGFVAEAELLRELHETRPQVCLVAMGTPKQERFAMRAVESGVQCLFVGCGGALDILSGHAVRAPKWMVDNYLEWLYRLIQQPSRWRRQSVLPVFLGRLLAVWIRRQPS
ncbi:MAG: WecB/TagA/CpsF family glycosyltransferase [Gammaproteobacteria bacterium]|nr:WecB/TagA/CpsF family glycosyltransferase [Gammaproteobacteria bacterium]